MIKFFRHIRKSLLIENKTSKYFKYAFGEIFLVVIGILIALQINNWNEKRKDRVQEQIVLNQLFSDFQSNLEQLDQKIKVRSEMMSSAEELLYLIDNESARHVDSLDKSLAISMAYTTYDPIKVDLANTGELALLTDHSLKMALNNWNSEINDIIEDEYNWKDYRNNNFIPFLLENYQFRSLRNKAFRANSLGRFSLNRETSEGYTDNDIGFSKHPVNMNLLLNNPDFEDHVSRCYSINSWTNSEALILRKRLLSIIELIQKNHKNI